MMAAETLDPDMGMRVVAPHIALTEHTGPGFGVFACFTQKSALALAGFGDGTIAKIEGAGLTPLANLTATPLCGLADVDGVSVLVGTDGAEVVRVGPDGATAVLLETGKAWVDQLAIHGNTQRRAIAFGKTAVVLDASGAELARFEDHPSTITGLAFSGDGSKLACSHYGGISVHDVTDPSKVTEMLEWHGSHTLVSWSPDSQFIVSALQENEMHCWRMPEAKGMRMSGYPRKIRAHSWTSDGKYLAVSGADTVTSWSFAGKGPAGKAPTEFGYVFNEAVTQVAAHPSSYDVAGGYSDGTVIIGNIEKETASIARPGSGAKVSALGWSPDGQSLIAVTEAGDVALCRINTQTS